MSENTVAYNIPLPGAQAGSKRLIDIQAVKTAIVTIDQLLSNAAANNASSLAAVVSSVSTLDEALALKVETSLLGAANGVATLNAQGKLNAAQVTGNFEAPLSFSDGMSRNVNNVTINFGSTAGTVTEGNDPRLSDTRPANGGAASTASTLQTARTINGVSFNGSANIVINAVDSTARIAASEKGVANGVATLDSTGLIPSDQLPSFVDDVLEFANLVGFPATGATGKIYVALDTNKTYRWSGSAYIYITSGAVDSVAGKTGVVSLVKADVGLNNVDNTSDVNKPVSTATTAAIGAAQAASTPIAHVGSGGAEHAVATTSVAGFMSGADKTKLNAITGTNTGDETTGTIQAKLGIITLSGSNTGDQTTITGNAGTATKLATPRAINGVAFDGSAPITINAVDSTARVAVSSLGVASGVATLGSDGKLTPAQVPSGGSASIAPESFTATAGQTAFVFSKTLPAGAMVFLNGALQTVTDTYTISGSTVTFLDARVALDKVTILG